ncbi:hypothetical protein GU926_07925 [Nibribacter ruber]|uniref:Uncharacterized protein n=1 Tax=Nibribacter ruber TaxID=2698458 RepID=A0A6P1NYB2_9BACT|nr:hypothetical protein [Nibribacter ruber]QHL87364.1 hypothetical protein GU926_07925 [Nibribacter ruber]
MKRASLFSNTFFCLAFLSGSFLFSACDTTPRERKEIAAREIDQLDEKASAAASKTKEELKKSREALARQREERKLREARGTTAGKKAQMEKELLGDYYLLSQATPENLKDAYVHFMEQVRARRKVWTLEDWDYANAIYKQLNDREKQLHDDIVLRHATKIKALQAEYLALENSADLKDYQRIKKEQAGN